mgnify:CR=1 FL=1
MNLIKTLLNWIDHKIGLDNFDGSIDFELEANDLGLETCSKVALISSQMGSISDNGPGRSYGLKLN